jgi:hypothetical protein
MEMYLTPVIHYYPHHSEFISPAKQTLHVEATYLEINGQ